MPASSADPPICEVERAEMGARPRPLPTGDGVAGSTRLRGPLCAQVSRLGRDAGHRRRCGKAQRTSWWTRPAGPHRTGRGAFVASARARREDPFEKPSRTEGVSDYRGRILPIGLLEDLVSPSMVVVSMGVHYQQRTVSTLGRDPLHRLAHKRWGRHRVDENETATRNNGECDDVHAPGGSCFGALAAWS